MIHGKNGFILISHANGMEKLGNSKHSKGIGLPSFVKGIQGNARYEKSVKHSKQPAAMSKKPFLGISGTFFHQGFGIVFVHAKSQGRERYFIVVRFRCKVKEEICGSRRAAILSPLF